MFKFNRIYDFHRPDDKLAPLFLTSPHSGRTYPTEYINATNFNKKELRAFEDCYVDRLYGFAPRLGSKFLIAKVPRIIIDLNRDVNEIDKEMFNNFADFRDVRTAKVLSGIGLFPKVIGSNNIYKEKLDWIKFKKLLNEVHYYWHSKLEEELYDSKSVFSDIVLLDCHSMPSINQNDERFGRPLPDFVVGDLWGKSCKIEITNFLVDYLENIGFTVSKNNPYAGAYILKKYGNPESGINALQIEVRKDLYLDEKRLILKDSFKSLKTILKNLIQNLSGVLLEKNLLKKSAE